MKTYKCDGCGVDLNEEESRNEVTISNVFNKNVHLHYCAGCATERWPHLKSMFGWTKHR